MTLLCYRKNPRYIPQVSLVVHSIAEYIGILDDQSGEIRVFRTVLAVMILFHQDTTEYLPGAFRLAIFQDCIQRNAFIEDIIDNKYMSVPETVLRLYNPV